METNIILLAIDQELMKLQQARALLVTSEKSEPVIKHQGRPKGPINKKAKPTIPKTLKHIISTEGKARIASAQKKRWAALKRASKRAKSVASKQIAKPTARPAKAKKAIRAAKAPTVKKVQPEAIVASQ